MYTATQDLGSRQKLLRESSRSSLRSNLTPATRQSRVRAAQLFNFEPLTKLKPEELTLLKAFNSYHSKKVIQASLNDIHKPNHSSYGSRGIRGYLNECEIDVVSLVEEQLLHRSRVRVLDIGSNKAEMLFELKAKFKDRVEVHSLDPYDFPRLPTDHHHRLYAEYLPSNFRGSFDLVIGGRSLEYCLMPDIASRNIIACLSNKGVANFFWREDRCMSPLGGPSPEEQKLRNCYEMVCQRYYKESMLTEDLESFITNLIRDRFIRDEKPEMIYNVRSLALRTFNALQRATFPELQAIKFTKVIMEAEKNPELAVSIRESRFSYLPALVKITNLMEESTPAFHF